MERPDFSLISEPIFVKDGDILLRMLCQPYNEHNWYSNGAVKKIKIVDANEPVLDATTGLYSPSHGQTYRIWATTGPFTIISTVVYSHTNLDDGEGWLVTQDGGEATGNPRLPFMMHCTIRREGAYWFVRADVHFRDKPWIARKLLTIIYKTIMRRSFEVLKRASETADTRLRERTV
jgi:hypothetical protein